MADQSEQKRGMYLPEMEHDACGIGFIAQIDNEMSHKVVRDALKMLEKMEHRGGQGSDPNSGDGAGILIQKPHAFLKAKCKLLGIPLPSESEYGVGVMLFPRNSYLRQSCKNILSNFAKRLNLEILGYRKLPTNNSVLGEDSLRTEPFFEHMFIRSTEDISQDELERKLYVLRNASIHKYNIDHQEHESEFYIMSISTRTLIYKGQLTTEQVNEYFLDLSDPRLMSAIAVVHSRFSTNTFPKWHLAQPFRYIAQNGEINTIRGNYNWMIARETSFSNKYFSDEEMELLNPIFGENDSDSANFDMAVELLVLTGRSLAHSMMMLIPEAWQNDNKMPEDKKAFYQYHATLLEPWDGPASMCFTNGLQVGATLDRNGLRPSRYTLTKDNTLYMASETGVFDVEPDNIKARGRLKGGMIFIVDLEKGEIISDVDLKKQIVNAQPYKEWIDEHMQHLEDLPEEHYEGEKSLSDILTQQKAFGMSREDMDAILLEMVKNGKEPLGSMGADWPLAVLSHKQQHLSSYFKQLFAQVTNPPIDPIRESMIMSLNSYLGGVGNLLCEDPESSRRIELLTPVLSLSDLNKIKALSRTTYQAQTFSTCYSKEIGLKKAIKELITKAELAVQNGCQIIILEDKDITESRLAIPSLLACSSLHHALIRSGIRSKSSIVLSVGDVWESHHFATLIGYGASAIHPYIVSDTIRQQLEFERLDTCLTQDEYFENYQKAINASLLKIMSKMGISTLQSYHGAQIFEALGINQDVIDKYFSRTITRIGGLSLNDIENEVQTRHAKAYDINNDDPNLDVGGVFQWKKKGEKHLLNPDSIYLLQQSTRKQNYDMFKQYCENVDKQDEEGITLRSRLDLAPKNKPISIEEVEPVESILQRFATGAMSFGSISYEAHSTLAIAMNRIGAKSNSGEGGEDPMRYDLNKNGDSECSAIKQVASGRFGVTANFLTNAKELQIKMAQGAKPGEGGQLPGTKVDDWIGATRHATPGVGLISPPPHHDIYSIEDLAQLIFDLKNANRDSRISVKLVSEAGVGTVAAGVAKAKADVILIAGHDGGTGASPVSSIKYTGLPWELGLSESHQTLLKNGLRNRVILQADGQMRTPRDLAIATMLGAEEWGIATAALVVEGCIMMRKCHNNTCPVGIATQNKELRKRFAGRPEDVVTFFTYMAEGLREIMAEFGYRTINEMVGQSQNLKMKDDAEFFKYQNIDLTPMLHKEKCRLYDSPFNQIKQHHLIESVLDKQIIADSISALYGAADINIELPIQNTDRTVGAMISNEITKLHGSKGLEKTINVKFRGTAGQSFGAFSTKGLFFSVEGDANDYVGKGLSGAELAIFPDRGSRFVPEDNIIVGNVCFYGATSGKAYIRGRAGERFCVRNSGAEVVVEGIGEHGCEYMTGGKVIILGDIGRNFAAGMSGGVAYIAQSETDILDNINREMVFIEEPDKDDIEYITKMLKTHVERTQSKVGKRFLDKKGLISGMIKIMPKEYKAVLEARKNKQEEDVYNG